MILNSNTTIACRSMTQYLCNNHVRFVEWSNLFLFGIYIYINNDKQLLRLEWAAHGPPINSDLKESVTRLVWLIVHNVYSHRQQLHTAQYVEQLHFHTDKILSPTLVAAFILGSALALSLPGIKQQNTVSNCRLSRCLNTPWSVFPLRLG